MQREELLESISHLRDELAGIEKVGPQTRERLAQVADELHRLLDPDDATTAEDVETSSEGLRGYLEEFEAEHPSLAMTIGKLADGLANLGI